MGAPVSWASGAKVAPGADRLPWAGADQSISEHRPSSLLSISRRSQTQSGTPGPLSYARHGHGAAMAANLFQKNNVDTSCSSRARFVCKARAASTNNWRPEAPKIAQNDTNRNCWPGRARPLCCSFLGATKDSISISTFQPSRAGAACQTTPPKPSAKLQLISIAHGRWFAPIISQSHSPRSLSKRKLPTWFQKRNKHARWPSLRNFGVVIEARH